MTKLHMPYWPKRVPVSLTIPQTPIFHNLQVSASRYPDKTAIYYYGLTYTYKEVLKDVYALSGFLQQEHHIQKGDRVIIFMQNSPQYIIAFYSILMIGGVVVPINPMNKKEELAFYIEDSEARVAIVGQELYEEIAPLVDETVLDHIIITNYRSCTAVFDEAYELPVELKAEKKWCPAESTLGWDTVISEGIQPVEVKVAPSDLALLPYTSGTTGKPKGCMHTHQTVQANIVGAATWNHFSTSSVSLATLPFFHVTGMQHSMNAPVYGAGTMAIMTRWNRDTAAKYIEKVRCTNWINISTMVVDFLANPKISSYDISSLTSIGGGGAPLPEAVGLKLQQLTGVSYCEGYGLTETISQTHSNPPDRPKLQCLGVPSFDVSTIVLDLETQQPVGPGKEGELLVNGPQVFKGYWRREEETKEAFMEIDGITYFRTGDIVRFDEDGYFFLVDRSKRMINVSGYKVWPTEVESILYHHPKVQQACVIGVPHERTGEQVKAFIIPVADAKDTITAEEIIEWAKEKMAAYKTPRQITFVHDLPVTASGKILWRVLQEQEKNKVVG